MDSKIANKIQNLIDTGTGDLHRLEEILMRVKFEKKLYNSDIAYVEMICPKDNENPIVFGDEPFVFEKSTVNPVKIHLKKNTIKKITIILILVGAVVGLVIIGSGIIPIGFDVDITTIPSLETEYYVQWINSNVIVPLCDVLTIPYFCEK